MTSFKYGKVGTGVTFYKNTWILNVNNARYIIWETGKMIIKDVPTVLYEKTIVQLYKQLEYCILVY